MAGYSKFNATIFCYANFTNANFSYSCLTCTSFVSAYFSNAIFYNTNFKDANFNSADFKYSRFMGVEFDNAVFDGIQLKHAITEGLLGFQVVSCQLNSSEQNRIVQYWPKLDIVTTGCFSGTMDELKAAIKNSGRDELIITPVNETGVTVCSDSERFINLEELYKKVLMSVAESVIGTLNDFDSEVELHENWNDFFEEKSGFTKDEYASHLYKAEEDFQDKE